jgi:hypothetical protein
MVLDVKNLVGQMNDVVNENKRLNNLKEKYIEHAATIKKISENLQEIKKQLDQLSILIDPVQSIKVKSPYRKMKPIIQECFELMRNGSQINREFLEKTYAFDPFQSYRIIGKLRRLNNIHVAKDGVEIRLFYDEKLTRKTL